MNMPKVSNMLCDIQILSVCCTALRYFAIACPLVQTAHEFATHCLNIALAQCQSLYTPSYCLLHAFITQNVAHAYGSANSC